jgi:hypothetical protein
MRVELQAMMSGTTATDASRSSSHQNHQPETCSEEFSPDANAPSVSRAELTRGTGPKVTTDRAATFRTLVRFGSEPSHDLNVYAPTVLEIATATAAAMATWTE